LKLKYEGLISELKKQLDESKAEIKGVKLEKKRSMADVPDLAKHFELLRVD
jgi:hypothetical protein